MDCGTVNPRDLNAHLWNVNRSVFTLRVCIGLFGARRRILPRFELGDTGKVTLSYEVESAYFLSSGLSLSKLPYGVEPASKTTPCM